MNTCYTAAKVTHWAVELEFHHAINYHSSHGRKVKALRKLFRRLGVGCSAHLFSHNFIADGLLSIFRLRLFTSSLLCSPGFF